MLLEKQDVSKLRLIAGNTTRELTQQLTEWAHVQKDIQFAIDQLGKHAGREWQLRKNRDRRVAVFVDEKYGKIF